jgi:transcriptional regulator with XRE-family HTH domain
MKKQKIQTVFGEWVKKSGLDTREIANKLGCSSSYVSALANGWSFPSRKLAKKIYELTGIGYEDLMYHNGGSNG